MNIQILLCVIICFAFFNTIKNCLIPSISMFKQLLLKRKQAVQICRTKVWNYVTVPKHEVFPMTLLLQYVILIKTYLPGTGFSLNEPNKGFSWKPLINETNRLWQSNRKMESQCPTNITAAFSRHCTHGNLGLLQQTNACNLMAPPLHLFQQCLNLFLIIWHSMHTI